MNQGILCPMVKLEKISSWFVSRATCGETYFLLPGSIKANKFKKQEEQSVRYSFVFETKMVK